MTQPAPEAKDFYCENCYRFVRYEQWDGFESMCHSCVSRIKQQTGRAPHELDADELISEGNR